AWDPRQQRPELWNLFNAQLTGGQTMRVFPLSNWTELDVWEYIRAQDIPLVSLYFAAERPVVRRDGILIMVDDGRLPLAIHEKPENKMVRFRSLGCYPLTAAIDLRRQWSERAGRLIDMDVASSMERKKREGYF